MVLFQVQDVLLQLIYTTFWMAFVSLVVHPSHYPLRHGNHVLRLPSFGVYRRLHHRAMCNGDSVHKEVLHNHQTAVRCPDAAIGNLTVSDKRQLGWFTEGCTPRRCTRLSVNATLCDDNESHQCSIWFVDAYAKISTESPGDERQPYKEFLRDCVLLSLDFPWTQ